MDESSCRVHLATSTRPLLIVIDLPLPLPHIQRSIFCEMAEKSKRQKTVVVGAGPVGALAALYAAQRGHDVEIYELRSGAFPLNRSHEYLCCPQKTILSETSCFRGLSALDSLKFCLILAIFLCFAVDT